MKTIKQRLAAPARIAFSAAALAYCFTLVSSPKVAALLGAGSPAWLAMAGGLALLATAVGAWRFKLLFDPVQRLPFAVHLAQYFKAGLFNVLLPSSMGGDLARVMMLGAGARTSGAGYAAALATVLLERLMGVFTLLLLSALVLPWTTLPVAWAPSVGAACLALPALAWCGVRSWAKLPPWARSRAQPFAQALHALRGHPGRCGAAVAASLLHQVLTVGITLAVVRAFGLTVATPLLFALTPLVWLATFVPITLGGMGLREFAFMRLFAQGAVAHEASLVMSLGTFGAMLLVALVGALWSFPMLRGSAKIHP